uniref:Uncharacterized protein n=1 Tax=Globodera rostochiensis TaxID=31243 RepID=A0A914HAC0_GLORO
MANKNLLRKRRAEMGAQKRWEKRIEKRASVAKATQARWAKKVDFSTVSGLFDSAGQFDSGGRFDSGFFDRSDNKESDAEPPTESQHTECVQQVNELSRQFEEKEKLLAQSDVNARSMEMTIEELKGRNAALEMELQRCKEEAEQFRKAVKDRQKAEQHRRIEIETELTNLESEILQTQMNCLKKRLQLQSNPERAFLNSRRDRSAGSSLLRVEQRLEMLGAYKSRWFQQYNENEIRNALRGTGPEHITTKRLIVDLFGTVSFWGVNLARLELFSIITITNKVLPNGTRKTAGLFVAFAANLFPCLSLYEPGSKNLVFIPG